MFPSGHAPGLPGISSSGRRQFPRLQLRGSAGFSPASLSSPSGKDARSERHDKEQKTRNNSPKNLTADPAEVKYDEVNAGRSHLRILHRHDSSREAAKECSPRRKPQLNIRTLEPSAKRRKKTLLTSSISPPHTTQSKSPRSQPPTSPTENKT